MTVTKPLPPLKARGREMDLSPEAFGWLRSSADIAMDGAALRERMAADGYLFLPSYLYRDEVIEARKVITEKLAAQGLLDPARPVFEGVLNPDGKNPYFRPELAKNNPALMKVLYDGPMMDLFARLFDVPASNVRHFDYTWMRAVGPGPGTSPHCDIVYMGRGTHDLFTAWTPLADIPLTIGGLMVLENSHTRTDVLSDYQSQDVDSYCENGPNAEAVRTGKIHWEHWKNWQNEGAGWDGAISNDPVALREQLGGRWLTCPEYRMGDVLIFSMRTVHASIDNTTNYIRLSSDTRYQRADEPADERWIGENPPAHGLSVKTGRIC
jgi:hypothetical protein